MPRYRCSALILLLVALWWPASALACSCRPLAGRGADNVVVVSGTFAEDIEDGVVSPMWNNTRRLIADRVWFGPDQREFRLVSHKEGPDRIPSPGYCARRIAGFPSLRVLAWLRPVGGGLYETNLCSLITWDSEQRNALVQSFQRSLRFYEEIDRRLQSNPDDPEAWRERLAIAIDLKDAYGRWRSLQRLIELTTSPDGNLLREAAIAADMIGDDAAAARLAGRALLLSPGDETIRTIHRLASLRIGYDEGLMGLTKKLDRLAWFGLKDTRIDLSYIDVEDFRIQDSALSGYIKLARFNGGVIRRSSLSRVWIFDTKFWALLARDLDLTDATIRNSSFDDGRFDRSDLSRATLESVSFYGQTITHSTFRGARLEDVRFVAFTSLTDVDFTGASFRSVHFDGARLNGVNLGRLAELRESSWTGAIVDCRTSLPPTLDVVKEGIIFVAEHCEGKPTNRDFTGPQYAEIVDWEELKLSGARFTGRRFHGATFNKSMLQSTDFSSVTLIYSHFESADLRGARFTNSTFDQVFFKYADLRGADLSSVTFKLRWTPGSDKSYGEFYSARYDAHTKWPSTFVDDKGGVHPFNPAEHGAILVKD